MVCIGFVKARCSRKLYCSPEARAGADFSIRFPCGIDLVSLSLNRCSTVADRPMGAVGWLISWLIVRVVMRADTRRMLELKERLTKFKLPLHEKKTRLIEF